MQTVFGTLIETADGSLTIKHEGHQQDFHSLEGAKFEAWQLYIVSSGILERLQSSETPVAVLDVGMGLGYNASATIAAWLSAKTPSALTLISLEIDIRLVAALAGGEAPWCKGWDASWLLGPKQLIKVAENHWLAVITHPSSSSPLKWDVYVGDASEAAIPKIKEGFEFVWQDPFTPELNPGMWSATWFERVRAASAPNVQLLTYSVARVVRDALEQGGWKAERFPAIGKKRHWLRGRI